MTAVFTVVMSWVTAVQTDQVHAQHICIMQRDMWCFHDPVHHRPVISLTDQVQTNSKCNIFCEILKCIAASCTTVIHTKEFSNFIINRFFFPCSWHDDGWRRRSRCADTHASISLTFVTTFFFFFFKSPLPERLSPELLRQSSGSQDKFFLVAQNTRTGFKPTILRHAGNTGVPIHGGQEEMQRYEPVMTSAKMTCCELQRVKTQTEQTEIQQSGPNHLHWRHRLIY